MFNMNCNTGCSVFCTGCSNGEEWYRLRSSVQQLMMRPKNMTFFLPAADPIAVDFVRHVPCLRDSSNEVPDFEAELAFWALES